MAETVPKGRDAAQLVAVLRETFPTWARPGLLGVRFERDARGRVTQTPSGPWTAARARYLLAGVESCPELREEVERDVSKKTGAPSAAARTLAQGVWDEEQHLLAVARVMARGGGVLWSAPSWVAALDADCEAGVQWLSKRLPDGTPFEVRPGKMHAFLRVDTRDGTRRLKQQLPIGHGTNFETLKIDLKPGWDTYVVCAPTVRQDGASYEWIVNLPEDLESIPYLSDALVAEIEQDPTAWKSNGAAKPAKKLDKASPAAPTLHVDERPRHDRLRDYALFYAAYVVSREELAELVWLEARDLFEHEPARLQEGGEVDSLIDWVWSRDIVRRPLAEELTDAGRARLFEAHFGHTTRWVHELKRWMIWNPRTGAWEEGSDEHVGKLFQQVEERVMRNAARSSGGRREDLKENALHLRVMKNISAARTVLKSSLLCSIEDFDRHPGRLLFPGWGSFAPTVVDLDSGEKWVARPEDMCTLRMGTHFDAGARDEVWEAFLAYAFEHAPDVLTYVHRMLGLSLHGVSHRADAPFLFGDAGTGKSTLIESVTAALGSYACIASHKTFVEQSRGGGNHNEDVAALRGKRFIATDEMEDTGRLGGFFKTFTAGGDVSARRAYGHQFQYRAQGTVWLQGNQQPKADFADPGIWRRVAIIRMDRRLEEGRGRLGDGDLRQHLRSRPARAAIAQWVLGGARAALTGGVQVPDSVRAEVDDYRVSQNPIAEWVEVCCEAGPGEVPVSLAYQSFKGWVKEEHGCPPWKLPNPITGRSGFETALAVLGWRTARQGRAEGGESRVRVVRGLRLRGQSGASKHAPGAAVRD